LYGANLFSRLFPYQAFMIQPLVYNPTRKDARNDTSKGHTVPVEESDNTNPQFGPLKEFLVGSRVIKTPFKP